MKKYTTNHSLLALLFLGSVAASPAFAGGGLAMNTSSFSVNTPVARFERSTSYSSTQSAFNTQYNTTMNSFRQSGGAYNPIESQTVTVQDSYSVGPQFAGYGVTYKASSPGKSWSAAEQALSDWDRTEYVRKLDSRYRGPSKRRMLRAPDAAPGMGGSYVGSGRGGVR